MRSTEFRLIRTNTSSVAKYMTAPKIFPPLKAAIVLLLVVGCRSLSSTPDKTIVNKFANIDTMPADVVAIRCMRDGDESFRLLFGAGWLIEWEHEKGAIRKSILDKESRDWLYKLTGQTN